MSYSLCTVQSASQPVLSGTLLEKSFDLAAQGMAGAAGPTALSGPSAQLPRLGSLDSASSAGGDTPRPTAKGNRTYWTVAEEAIFAYSFREHCVGNIPAGPAPPVTAGPLHPRILPSATPVPTRSQLPTPAPTDCAEPVGVDEVLGELPSKSGTQIRNLWTKYYDRLIETNPNT